MKDRYNKILELLTKEKKIEVNELSQILGVSNVTIRKDLDALEEKGIIKRGHGYAILANKDDINGRLAYHYETKKRIAQKAAELIHDGENGFLVEVNDEKKMAERVCQLLEESNKRNEIIKRAKCFSDEFTFQHVKKELEHIYF